MKQSEFKKAYSNIRKSIYELNESMRNMYCGDDDAASERFNHHLESFLKDKPALRYAVMNSFEDCYLYERQDRLLWFRDERIGQKLSTLKDMMQWRKMRVSA